MDRIVDRITWTAYVAFAVLLVAVALATKGTSNHAAGLFLFASATAVALALHKVRATGERSDTATAPIRDTVVLHEERQVQPDSILDSSR